MDTLRIRGARTHNLRNIDVDLPRGSLVVITGPSGSGKSSLAFDTLYAEGQRRYVESLSAYARQFLPRHDKPDVDAIEGLSPAIAISQRTGAANPRSTVGTVTEVLDYLRLLYARLGTPYCPDHPDQALRGSTVDDIVDAALQTPTGTLLHILAPLGRRDAAPTRGVVQEMRSRGFVRFRLDGVAVDGDDPLAWAAASGEVQLDVVVDRLRVQPSSRSRIADSVEMALRIADGRLLLLDPAAQVQKAFSTHARCPVCQTAALPMEPSLFSFNSPQGACQRCAGLGYLISEGKDGDARRLCPECSGTRLCLQARRVLVAGAQEAAGIEQVLAWPLDRAHRFLLSLDGMAGQRAGVVRPILRELDTRLRFLLEVGVEYLSLNRGIDTLSGGEAQRIRLASQIGTALSGVLYVLDEPSIGLHPRDGRRLIDSLRRLQALGNSVLVVEHDEDMIMAADHLVDMGPGAGEQGGLVVAQGTPQQIAAMADSPTGAYLSGRRRIRLEQRAVSPDGRWLKVLGACGNNLRKVDLEVPVGRLTCVTGVSGSGKSTLVNDTLARIAAHVLNGANREAAAHDRCEGLEHFDRLVQVDQGPIGRSPRSNPATYTGMMTPLRELFAATPTARERGYGPARFSFNTPGGRCEACQGDGVIQVPMHFLPDVYVVCDACRGRRYNRETLEVRYRDLSISDALDLSIAQARDFFSAVPALQRRLAILGEVGLDYLRLGQSALSLSGGEAQRIKLAVELSKRDTGRSLYLLDEPTTGLHFQDVDLLMAVLGRLRDAGNTLVVIEHHLDVIRLADWIVDLGPEAGERGGEIVVSGTPAQVAGCAQSHTGACLRARPAAA